MSSNDEKEQASVKTQQRMVSINKNKKESEFEKQIMSNIKRVGEGKTKNYKKYRFQFL